jgi:hypothetical protein
MELSGNEVREYWKVREEKEDLSALCDLVFGFGRSERR